MLATISRLNRPVLRIMQTRMHGFFKPTTALPIKRYMHLNNAYNDEARQLKEEYLEAHRNFNKLVRKNYEEGLKLYNEEDDIKHVVFASHHSAEDYFNGVITMLEGIDKDTLSRVQRIIYSGTCFRYAVDVAFSFSKKKLELISWDEDYVTAKKIMKLCEKAEQMLPRDKKGMEFEDAIYVVNCFFRSQFRKLGDIFDEAIQAHYDKGVELYEDVLQLSSKKETVPSGLIYDDALFHFNRIITMSKQLWVHPHWEKQQITVAEAYLYKAEILFRISECDAEKTTLEKQSITDDEIECLVDAAAKLLPPEQDKERLSKKFCKIYDLFISKWSNEKSIVSYSDTSMASVLINSYKDVNTQEIKYEYLKVYIRYNEYLIDNLKKGSELCEFAGNNLESNDLSSGITRCYNQLLAEAHFDCVLTMSEGISEKNLTRSQRTVIAAACIQRAIMMSDLFENKAEKLMCWEVDNETRTKVYKLCEKAQSILPRDKKGLMFKKEICQIQSPFLVRSFKFYEMFDKELMAFYQKGLEYKERISFIGEELTTDDPDSEGALYNFNHVIKMSTEIEEEELLPEQQTIIAEAFLCKAEIISLVYRCQKDTTWEERHKTDDEIEQLVGKASKLLPPDKKGNAYSSRLDVLYAPFILRWSNGEPLGRYNKNNMARITPFEKLIAEEYKNYELNDLIDSDNKSELEEKEELNPTLRM